jgi:predicted nuclease of predicted toxin-antitoxin system
VKFLIDQSLPLRSAGALREEGYDALHAREADLSTAPDEVILQWCRSQDRIVVTPDSDFPTLLVLARASGPSVIRIFAQGLSAADVAGTVLKVASAHEAMLQKGALVTVRRHLTSIRELPIAREES